MLRLKLPNKSLMFYKSCMKCIIDESRHCLVRLDYVDRHLSGSFFFLKDPRICFGGDPEGPVTADSNQILWLNVFILLVLDNIWHKNNKKVML